MNDKICICGLYVTCTFWSDAISQVARKTRRYISHVGASGLDMQTEQSHTRFRRWKLGNPMASHLYSPRVAITDLDCKCLVFIPVISYIRICDTIPCYEINGIDIGDLTWHSSIWFETDVSANTFNYFQSVPSMNQVSVLDFVNTRCYCILYIKQILVYSIFLNKTAL